MFFEFDLLTHLFLATAVIDKRPTLDRGLS